MSGNIWFVSQHRSCTSRNAILATFVVVLLMSVVSGSFHGKSSQQNNSYRALGQEDINVVDYTGSVTDILDMAHEKADRENANADADADEDTDAVADSDVDGDVDGDVNEDVDGIVDTDAEVTEPSPIDLGDDVETLSCPGKETFSEMQEIKYKYSLTFNPNSDRDDVGRQLVVALNQFLGQELLDCDKPGRKLRQRKLEKGLVVAVNTRDGTPSSEKCNEVECEIYDGEIRLLLAENVDFGNARFSALTSVRKFIDQVAIHRVEGLKNAAYLAPDFANPNAASNEAGSQANKSGISSSVVTSSTGIVIFSCAAAAFVIAFGVFVYSRRNKIIDSDFSTFTKDKDAGSDLQIAPTQSADEDSENEDERTSGEDDQEDGSLDPRSPFSKMLPAAYQLGDSMSMSVILENENESVASSNVTSVNGNISSSISDGFVTDMDSSVDETYDASDTVGGTPVLGARRRNVSLFMS
mmetsp:Transcript_25046/g.35053  ORF Transcript_25046/g.35053 Transcript_25046/m.35053 type:complete len:469 (+) Transcript_25046:99-1505(+)